MGKLYKLTRAWHKWMGLFGALMMLLFGVTGILLNHAEEFGLKPRPEPTGRTADHRPAPSPARVEFRTTSEPAVFPVSLPAALAAARAEVGDLPCRKLELKRERGEWVYRLELETKPRVDIFVSATTGEVSRKVDPARFNPHKLILDLHRFGFVEGRYKLFADFFAGLLILLSLSGAWMGLRLELTTRRARRLAAQRRSFGGPAEALNSGTKSTSSGR